MYSSQSKKMDPPGPKQTNEVHNYVGNRTQWEYRASKKGLYLPDSCLWDRGPLKFLNDTQLILKQIKGGHLDL